jgi:HK97 family phage prohead protease
MNDPMRIKSLPFEVKAADAAKREIEGYAAAFMNVDSWGDRIMPGAFTKTIQENASRIKVAWQHDSWDVIGKPLELKEDEIGLFTRSYISKTQRGDEALTLAKDGVITEMSIGYRLVPDKFTLNDWGGYDIYELKLMEYSLVTWAANPLARVTGVKSADVAQLLRATDLDDPAATRAAVIAIKALLGTEPVPATQPLRAAAAAKAEPASDHSAFIAALAKFSASLPEIKEYIRHA